MNLSAEMLYYIRSLGVQIGRYPDHYNPDHSRALVYSALESYRREYVAPDRREEFYTIAMAALQDGEQEGTRLLREGEQLVEAEKLRVQALKA